MFTYKGYKLELSTTDDGLASHYICSNDEKGISFSVNIEEVGIDQDKLRQIIDIRDKEVSDRPDLPIESKISLLDKFITEEFEKFIDCEIDQQEFFKKAKEYRVSRAKLLRKFYKEAKKQQK